MLQTRAAAPLAPSKALSSRGAHDMNHYSYMNMYMSMMNMGMDMDMDIEDTALDIRT